MASTAGASVAAEIRAAMARQRRSQAELAAAKGHDQHWWSKRLLGKVPLSVDDLLDAADFLGVEVTDLLPKVAA